MLRKKRKTLKSNQTPVLVVGLGNPGNRYAATRHNAGFIIVELLAKRLNVFYKKPFFKKFTIAACEGMILVKPLTFMNRSGIVLPPLMNHYSINHERNLVIVDNMDLPPGKCRLKRGGSDAGHNGIKSIMAETGTKDFMRLYIGVGRPENGVSVIDHVLGRFTQEEGEKINSLGNKIADELVSLEDKFDFAVLQGKLNGLST